MPAKDAIHDIVKTADIKDGWKITHDPYIIQYDDTRVYADLGAEKVIAAEKDKQKILVEIKSFLGLSVMDDLENALGKFVLYRSLLKTTEPERQAYLALSNETYANVLDTVSGQVVMRELALRVILVNLDKLEVTRWIEQTSTDK
jgi:hypothetical protein